MRACSIALLAVALIAGIGQVRQIAPRRPHPALATLRSLDSAEEPVTATSDPADERPAPAAEDAESPVQVVTPQPEADPPEASAGPMQAGKIDLAADDLRASAGQSTQASGRESGRAIPQRRLREAVLGGPVEFPPGRPGPSREEEEFASVPAASARRTSSRPIAAPPRVTRRRHKAAPAAAPAAVPGSVLLNNAYWLQRLEQIDVQAGLGHANVVFLGDSITDWLATGAGWPVWDLCFEPLGAEDFGVAGYNSTDVLGLVETGVVADVSPRVVVLMIGTNDLALGHNPAAVVITVGGILEVLASQLPRTRVLLLGILPRGAANDGLRSLIAETNAGLARLADGARVHYVDIGSDFLWPDGSIPPEFMADHLHPTLFGYQIYAANVLGPLEALLDAGPLPRPKSASSK